MASFFKRAATSALRRREEVRDTNQFNLEADSDRAVKFLATAETERLSKKKVLDSYDKITGPVISKLSADFPELPGSKGLEAVVLNAYIAVRPDGKITGEAINNTTRILKETLTTTPTAFDSVLKPSTLTSLGSDASKGLRDITDTPSPDTPYSIKSEDLKSQTVRMLGDDDDLNLVGRTATTAFNVFLGLPATSVPQLTKKRYGDMFGGGAAGEEAYEKTLNYIQDVSDGNDDTEIPDIPPELAARLYDSLRVVTKQGQFEKDVVIQINKVLKPRRDAILADAKAAIGRYGLLSMGGEDGTTIIAGDPTEKISDKQKATIQREIKKANRLIEEMTVQITNIAIDGWKTQLYYTPTTAALGALSELDSIRGSQKPLPSGGNTSTVTSVPSKSIERYAQDNEDITSNEFQTRVKREGRSFDNINSEDRDLLVESLKLDPNKMPHYFLWNDTVVSFVRGNLVVYEISPRNVESPLSNDNSSNGADGLSTEMSALGAVQRRPARVGGQLVNAQQNS